MTPAIEKNKFIHYSLYSKKQISVSITYHIRKTSILPTFPIRLTETYDLHIPNTKASSIPPPFPTFIAALMGAT